MLTVGEILTNARTAKKITLDQAEKATRIRAKFLVALEKNDFTLLPPNTFTRGFIKNYAEYLGLSQNEVLAFYRRQITTEKPTKTTHKPDLTNQPKILLMLSPTTIGIAVLVVVFFTYLIISYINFAGKPILNVDTPPNNTVVSAEKIKVLGKTDPDAVLTINDQTIQPSQNGTFDVEVTLHPGLNTIDVVSTNKFKRQSIIVRNVRLEK